CSTSCLPSLSRETTYSTKVISPLTVLEKLRSRRPGGALAGCMAWTWKIS
ncbi:FIG00959101: hypothetical protein, partial [Pseudomonas fluorescens]